MAPWQNTHPLWKYITQERTEITPWPPGGRTHARQEGWSVRIGGVTHHNPPRDPDPEPNPNEPRGSGGQRSRSGWLRTSLSQPRHRDPNLSAPRATASQPDPNPEPDSTRSGTGTGREPDSTPAGRKPDSTTQIGTAPDRNPSRMEGRRPRCMETCPTLVGSFAHRKAPPPTTHTTTPIRNPRHVLTRKGAHVLFVRNYFQFTIIVFLT